MTTLAPVFPYDAYRVFAGRCPEADPTVAGVPPVTAAAPPGGSVAASVPLYPVTVKALSPAGKAVAGATVTATEVSSACGALLTYGLSQTAADGTSLTGLPLGAFAVKVTLGPKSTTVPVTVTAAGATVTVTL